MSLADLRKLTEEGVTSSPAISTARAIMLSPESSMEIQRQLGSDIVMCFDECPPCPPTRPLRAESMRLSMRWAERSRAAFGDRPGHALFGIQQGGSRGGSARRKRRGAAGIGFDGLRHRRAGRGRGAGGRCSACSTTRRGNCPRTSRAI